jgi:hypothetical protein
LESRKITRISSSKNPMIARKNFSFWLRRSFSRRQPEPAC